MFFNAEDDEQDFMSPGGSKLASLFGMDKATGQKGNETLTYTAPKQPKKKEAVPEGGGPTVIVASVIHAYKYLEGKYASQGKLGAALLGNQANKDYRILLYVNQQKQVTNAKITLNFAFNIQQNNYASFYDDARYMWSVMFESPEAAEKFAKEVAIAKANSVTGSLTDLIQQDLSAGDGGVLESGDSVEVKYTGWLFTNGILGKVFDQSQQENYFRFKVSKGRVIKGWDQGMLGMKKGAKRLLIIPPSLGYGLQGAGERVPPDSTLVFEVQVMRVKLQKGDSPQESPVPTPAPTPAPVINPDQDDFEDAGVKGRTRSINEHITQSPDTNKAKLISRMARMGQPMLPFQGAVPAQPEDSDEEMHQQVEHVQAVPAAVKPNLPVKPRSLSSAGMAATANHVIITQAQPAMMQSGIGMVSIGNPGVVMTTNDGLMHQQQPAFLQNLPGAQQLAVYQNPNAYLQQQQQQQTALLQQQQQLLQQQQQQLLGQGLMMGGLQAQPPGYGVPAPAPLANPAPTPAPSSTADGLAPALLTETRQQNTEVRIGLSKMTDKVDKILEKIEHINSAVAGHGGGGLMPYSSSMPVPSMEANVLMQNITRIVQENERLKKDLYDQSHKVHEQNDKIAALLQTNQKFVEQSHSVLEQRNEGYKTTATQSQARVLALEQEKVHLATELSSASAQISTLQLELGEYRKREGELRQQIQLTTNTSTSNKDELEKLRAQREEDEQKISNLTASVRDEKQARKAAEVKLTNLSEELADIKLSHSTLEKNLSERKRKAAEERRKMEEDMEDAKISFEQTIEGLRERLRKQKTSVDAETENKVSKIEEDLSREWQTKCDRIMIALTDKHNRQIEEMKSEKEELLRKIEELDRKVVSVRSSGSSTEKQVMQLQDELAEMKLWKDKYDSLRIQAGAMKDKYEKRLEELEGEKEEEGEKRNEIVEKAKEQRQELQQQIQQLQQQTQQLRSQLQANAAVQRSVEMSSPATSADIATEVKKIMNSVYQSLRSEIDTDDSYMGAEVLATVLNIIKQTTLKLVNPVSTREEESEEEEGEEEDEEDSEEEEENQSNDEGIDEVDEDEKVVPVSAQINQSASKTGPSVSAVNQSASGTESSDHQIESIAVLEEASPPSLSKDDITVIEKITPEDEEEVQSNEDIKNVTQETREEEIQEMTEDKQEVVQSAGSSHDVIDTKLTQDENLDDTEDFFEEALDDLTKGPTSAANQPASIEADISSTTETDLSSTTETDLHNTVEVDSNQSSVLTSDDEEQQNIISDTTFGDEIKEHPKSATLEGSTVAPPKPSNDVREPPPPLFDDDEDDTNGDGSLFGRDSAVSQTLGLPPQNLTSTKKTENKTTGKKLDLSTEEDLKPQPPPPLFGDDSDDDDLDWLS